jgi:hypothetical protein
VKPSLMDGFFRDALAPVGAVGRPFNGVHGQWLKSTLQVRTERLRQCLAQGEPVFERDSRPGYRGSHERCTRCHTLKRQHQLEDPPGIRT